MDADVPPPTHRTQRRDRVSPRIGARHRPWHADILAAAAVAVLGALAFLVLPEGSLVRGALGLAVVLFVPGFLLVEAVAGPTRDAQRRILRLVVAVGLSPAVVGLLALSTSLVPGGFRPGPIVAAVLVGCLVLAGVCLWRRVAALRRAPGPVASG